MTYEATALAIPGLAAGWMLDDASGTTLADFGSNNLPLTLQARGTLAGTAVLPESARSLTSVSTAGAATASRAVTGGTPLQVSTGFTYCVWCTMGTPVATGYLGGRNNNWQIRQAGGAGTMAAAIWVGGVAHTLTGRATIIAGQSAFVAITFDGHDFVLLVNNAIEARLTVPGSINATTDEMDVGSGQGGDPFSGQLQGACVFNRALSLGELRKLLRAGDSTHAIEQTSAGAYFDLVSDSSAVVAASAQTRYCGYCGGLMRANERAVTTTNDSFHPTCHAASVRTPVVPTSGSGYSDFATQAIHLIREYTNAVGRKTNPGDQTYSDGTQYVVNGVSVNEWPQTGGVGAAAAILHRYLRAGKRSPWLAIVRMMVANLMANQAATGSWGAVTDGNGFVQVELGLMVLMTRSAIDPATWNTWRDSFLAGCYFELNGTPYRTAEPVFTSGVSDATYYINGNRNLQIALLFYIAYLVTGDSYWDTQYEAELSYLIAPPLGAGSGPGNSNAGFGLWNYNTSALIPESGILSLSDTTDMAYLAESSGTDTPGIDWDYLQLQIDFAHQLWLLSGDARIVKLMNVFRNCANQRLNRSTWIYTATGGTRHNLTTAWLTTVEHSLVFKYGRGDITVADLASLWTLASGGLEANYRSQGMVGNIAYYRGLSSQVGSILMAQADWPGVPK